MPLVTDYNHVREVHDEARELGVALPEMQYWEIS